MARATGRRANIVTIDGAGRGRVVRSGQLERKAGLASLAEEVAELTYVPNELLSKLVGDRLVAVTFVLDSYIQLQFDRANMNIEVWPTVHYGGRVWRASDPGYGDCLRHLCGLTVEATSEESGDGLRLKFEKGQIHINPTRDEVYVEIALLQLMPALGSSTPGQWMCWRLGEESFEHLA